MNRILEKEWKKHIKKEEQYFLDEKKKISKKKEYLILQKIESKIPEKVISGLNKAFYETLEKIMIYGDAIIEKSFKKEDISLEFDINEIRIQKSLKRKSFKILDRTVKQGQMKNKCLATAEGLGLGIIGVGIADIPIFLGVILKSIYEIALSYGYDYKDEKEKVYILRLIVAGLETGEEKKEKDRLVEEWLIEKENQNCNYDLKEEIKTASEKLANKLLVAKFIQGFFVVGVVGGTMSILIQGQIIKYVSIKYKKRYLSFLKTRIK